MGRKKWPKEDKLNYITAHLSKLMENAKSYVNNGEYNLALSALSSYCSIQYVINQVYTDKDAENLVAEISSQVVKTPTQYKADRNTILFYDGFGLDLRGWAAAYVRALICNGYRLIYVTSSSQKNKIPHILMEIENTDSISCFVDMKKGQMKWIEDLNSVFVSFQPCAAFFYTTPNDVAGAAVFDAYKGKVDRFQVDLTDHAFWIGVNSADYFLECRIPGASNAIYERGVARDRLINIDCCLYVNRDIDDTPLPFDIENEKYIFSGGALYKTLGDDRLLFYKVIDEVLNVNTEIKYLYAGNGDSSELNKLSEKYNGRVFYITERKDFIRLIEHCEFMWNTYPMFGGLMMRYAANAGKIPLTLKHGNDQDGILKNQSELEIEFNTCEEVIDEANKLLKDQEYKKKKEKLLKNSVITEDVFASNLKMIIEEHHSEFVFDEISRINTEEFRMTYLERLEDPDRMLANSIISKSSLRLGAIFPKLLFVRMINYVFKGNR